MDFYIKSVCKTGEDDDNEAGVHCVSGLVGRSQGCALQHCFVATRERSSWMLTTKI